jgi:hypothetical protein
MLAGVLAACVSARRGLPRTARRQNSSLDRVHDPPPQNGFSDLP